MYDKIKLMLYDLPTGYNWQTVLQRTVVKDYFANGTGGKGYWHGRKVIVTETYVSLRAVFLNAYGGIIHVLCHWRIQNDVL